MRARIMTDLSDQELGKNARQLTIAKIPTLLVLDAAVVRDEPVPYP